MNYPSHQLANSHQKGRGGPGGMNSGPPPSRGLQQQPHHMPRASLPPVPSHSGPLLPLPPGFQPPPRMQGSPKHPGVGGGGGGGQVIGGQKYSPIPHPPGPPMPSQLQPQPPQPQQQPVSLGELSAGVGSLADLAPRVKALGFPASCSFVLGLLER